MNCFICDRPFSQQDLSFGKYYNLYTDKGFLSGRACLRCVEKETPDLTVCPTCNKNDNDDCQCWD